MTTVQIMTTDQIMAVVIMQQELSIVTTAVNNTIMTALIIVNRHTVNVTIVKHKTVNSYQHLKLSAPL
jgi:hypothetical protein